MTKLTVVFRNFANAVKTVTQTGVRRDVVRRLYKGVLYFLNIVRFLCTRINAISLTSIKYLPFADFYETHKCLIALCAGLLYRI